MEPSQVLNHPKALVSGWLLGVFLGLCALPSDLAARPSISAGDLWADKILGQSDFSEIAPNKASRTSLCNPSSVVVDRVPGHNRMYVYDSGNNRVLGVNLAGLTDGQGAEIVLGQPDFNRTSCNGDSNWQNFPNPPLPSSSSLCAQDYATWSPAEVGTVGNMAVDGQGNLYVPDFFNNRVLRYDWPIAANGQGAAHIWGQEDPSGFQFNKGNWDFLNNGCKSGLEPDPTDSSIGFRSPTAFVTWNPPLSVHSWAGVAVDPWGNLWVADSGNHRVIRFRNPNAPNPGVPLDTADEVLGQEGDFTTRGEASLQSDMYHLRAPSAVRVDPNGNVFVADALGRVLIFRPSQAPDGTPILNANNVPDYDPSQPAQGVITENLHLPVGLELDPSGDLWVMDKINWEGQCILFHVDFGASITSSVVKMLLGDYPIPGRNALCGPIPKENSSTSFFKAGWRRRRALTRALSSEREKGLVT
jgi:hypothetical protein